MLIHHLQLELEINVQSGSFSSLQPFNVTFVRMGRAPYM